MSMRVSDPIRATSRGTAEQAIAGVDLPDEQDTVFLRALSQYAPVVGIDAAIAVAHTGQETAGWTSTRWKEGDPAGIGVPHDDTPEPFAYTGGENSALVYLTCLNRLVERTRPEPWLDTLTVDQRRWIDTVWKRHCDQARAAGVRVRTIDDLNTRYQADGDSHATWAWNPDAAAEIAAWGNRLFPNLPDAQEEPPMAKITYGNVQKPAIIDMICAKPFDGAGFTRVAPRLCYGACDHITDGEASLEWYHDFFATGGERQYDALVDYVIDQQGRIAMLNDPFGTRSPWASGGSDGLEGDGPLFVRTLGIGAINGGLASIEHVGRSPARMTDAQLEASARLKAWLFDGANNHGRGARVPWSSFPVNPHTGCVTHMQHWEFATKPCPGAGIRGQTDALQNRIRALLKAGQEGGNQDEAPPIEPVEPDHDRYPPGIDKALATDWFGVGALHREDGSAGHFQFHEGRAWAEAWLARGNAESTYPAVDGLWQFRDDPETLRQIVRWKNGWTLVKLNSREGFKWA